MVGAGRGGGAARAAAQGIARRQGADFAPLPGGKAAQLADRRRGHGDRPFGRAVKRLAANFQRLKLIRHIVADIAGLKAQPFDAILIDAPCLATGTIRRHPDIAWTKKPTDIAALVAVQARMLDKAVELVKPGGAIVYCTCSLEPEEGESQVAALLRRNPDVVRSPIAPAEVGGVAGAIDENGELRTLPCHLPAADPRLAGLDGFFAARLSRRG